MVYLRLPLVCCLAVSSVFAEPELVPLSPPTSTPTATPAPPSVVVDSAKPTKTLPPAELAKLLPDPVPEWKAGETTSSNETAGKGFLISTANREYSKIADTAGEYSVDITLTDMVNRPDYLRSQLRMWSYTNDKDASGFTKPRIVSGYPAQETWTADDQQHTLTIVVGGRYLLEIHTVQLPVADLEKWLAQVDIKKLAATKP